MAKLFNKGVSLTPRQAYERKYNTARSNLLLVVIVTLGNLALVSAGSDSYFLFSAYIPYFITAVGLAWCGMLPSEFYDLPKEEYIFYHKSLFVAFLILAVMITSLYLLAWFMSKKNRGGWLIFALVFFGIDTVGMLVLNGFAADSIMNIVFHVWVIYYLVMGIIAHRKLKNYPYEDEVPANIYEAAAAQPQGEILESTDTASDTETD